MWMPTRRAPPSLRGQLVALVVAAGLLPLVLATAWLTWTSQRTAHAAALDLLDARADQLAGDIDNFHDHFGSAAGRWARASAASQVLAALPEPATAALAALEASMEQVVASDERLAAITLLDAAGRVVVRSARGGGGYSSAADAFQAIVQTTSHTLPGRHAVTPLWLPGQIPRFLYSCAVVGEPGARTLGHLVLEVDAAQFWSAVRASNDHAGAGSFAVVIDEYRVRVADSTRPAYVFHPVTGLSQGTRDLLTASRRYGPTTAELLAAPIEAPEVAAYLAQRGTLPGTQRHIRAWMPSLQSYALNVPRHLVHVPWTVFLCLPEQAIADHLWPDLWRSIAVALLALLAALGLGFWMTRRILAPLQAVQVAVHRLAQGDFSRGAESADTMEFRELLQSFQAMADALHAQQQGLAATVAERTAALHVSKERLEANNAELMAQASKMAAQAAELVAQQEQLQQRAKDLETAATHKSQFMTNMSHELRTPLNAVIGFSDLMLESKVPLSDDDQRLFITDIRSSGQHLLALINDILDLARIEAGHLRLELDVVYPPGAIDEAIDVAAGMAVRRNITLLVVAVCDLPVVADRVRLRQVLANLLSNAVKFSPLGAQVQVGAEPDGDAAVRFWVRDAGQGIGPELQARLFTPFTQGDDPMTKQHGGTGLGLAISRTLVESMEGKIGLESALHVGSRFWFTLPRATGFALADRRATASGHFSATLAGVRVLVACADERDAAALADPLRAVGAVVRIATTMVAALDAALAQPPQACVCGERLADGSTGTQVVAALRADPETAAVPCVLVVAAGKSDEDLERLRHDLFAVATRGDFTADDWVATIGAAVGLPAFSRGQASPHADPGGPVVLIVDDNDLNRELLRRVVLAIGVQVQTARDGREALHKATLQPPQLVLLDLAMPGMDGYATLAALRELPGMATVPAVAVSALAMRSDEERALQSGFAAFVSKPIDVVAFDSLVRRFLVHRQP